MINTLDRISVAPAILMRFVYPGTSGYLREPAQGETVRRRQFPPTAEAQPTSLVFDLSSLLQPSVGFLEALLLPLARAVQSGTYGDVRLFLIHPDSAVRDYIRWMANDQELPLYVAASAQALQEAEAVGPELTHAENGTLELLARAGGWISASMLASLASIKPSAATNRLVNLHKKGLIFRLARARSEGDLFVDPRAPSKDSIVEAMVRGAAKVSPPRELARTIDLLRRTLASEDEDSPQVY